MKKNFNRVIATVLSLAICMSLVPKFSVQAMVTSPEATKVQRLKAEDSIPSEFSGIIFTLDKAHDTANSVMKVQCTMQNVPAFMGGGMRFLFDDTAVTMCTSKGMIQSPPSASAFISGKVLEGMANETGLASSDDGGGGIVPGTTKLFGGADSPLSSFYFAAQEATLDNIDFKMLKLDFTTNNVLTEFKLWWNNISDDTDLLLPQGQEVLMFTFYFKPAAGKTLADVNDKTFGLLADTAYAQGAGVRLFDREIPIDIIVRGFPAAPVVTYDVDVTVNKSEGGTHGVGAMVTIDGTDVYGVNAQGKLVKDSVQTNLKLAAGNHTYSITSNVPTENSVENVPFTVSVGGGAATFATTKKTIPSHEFTIKVADGDNSGAAISGASVSVSGGSAQTTAADGTVKTEKAESATPYTLNVTANGYVSNAAGTVKVSPADPSTFSLDTTGEGVTVNNTTKTVTVTLFKKQKGISLSVLDSKNALLKGALVTITKNPAGKVPDTIVDRLPLKALSDASGIAPLNLPAGDFMYTISASGYEPTAPVALTITNEKVTVGGTLSGGTVTGGQEATFTNDAATIAQGMVPTEAKPVEATDPLYSIVGTWDNTETPTTMTVKVSLKNIKAATGTFGIKYDTDIFKSITYVGEQMKIQPVQMGHPSGTGKLDNPVADATLGYHMVVWEGSKTGDISNIVDGTNGEVLLATYTLKVKDSVDVNALINDQSLYVMPASHTAYQAIAQATYQNDQELVDAFMHGYWRPVDAENETSGLGAGRISKDKALDGGFYQIYETADGQVSSRDIRSQFIFPNPNNNVRIKFDVMDTKSTEGNHNHIKDATVTIFKADDIEMTTPFKVLTTDENGGANLTSAQGQNYKYYVKSAGYWPAPGGTVIANENNTTAVQINNASIEQQVKLQPKTYHSAAISVVDATGTPEAKQNAKLSGTPYAYNNLDYYFSVDPVAGWEWVAKPTELDVIIAKGNETDDTDVTLKATFDKTKNKFKILGSAITGNPLGTADDAGTAMDETLQAGDVTIKLPVASLQQAQYTITAIAGEKGTVTADPTDGVNTTDPKALVQTLSGGKTDSATFTFTPDAIGDGSGSVNIISSVVINGVAIPGVMGSGSYKYQFTGVNAHQTITVTFQQLDNPGAGEVPEPMTDPVITVVTGQFGSVKVGNKTVAENSVADFMAIEKTPTTDGYEDFTATVTPTSGTNPEYVIDKVMVNGLLLALDGSATDLDGVGAGTATAKITAVGVLSISNMEKGKNYLVTAVFKVKDGESIQVIVTTNVGKGVGDISPIGASVHNIGDTPTFVFKPYTTDGYTLGGILFDGKKVDSKDVDLITNPNIPRYTTPALARDVVLVGNFAEKTYEVRMVAQMGDTPVSTAKTPAKVTLVRAADNETMVFDSQTISTGSANFTINIPKGVWTVTFTKNGYLDYTVTGFAVTGTESLPIYFGAGNSETAAKPVVMKIGDASRDGRLINIKDVAQVINGLTVSPTDDSKAWANISENPVGPKVEDAGYAKTNFGAKYTTVTYDAFKTKP